MKGRITLEDLAIMVQNGFQQMDLRLNGVDHRLKSLEDRMERVELRLDQGAYRFELVELQHRVGVIEQHIGLTK